MEKDSQIRQTIRRHILPLIQAIYEDDPADVTLYCFDYFDGLLHERELDGKEIGDSAGQSLQESSYKADKGQISEETRVLESIDASYTNLQGSASDPLLTKDKHGEGLSLRETSSWDIASTHQYATVPREVLERNLVDAMGKIGDQPSLKVLQEGRPVKDAEAGDTSVKKEKELGDNNFIDNQMSSNIMHESEADETHNVYGLPSAPPYSSLHEEEALKSNEINRVAACQQSNQNSIHSEAGSSANVPPYNCKNENLKPLSPNSSFGFVPHLNRYESKEKAKEVDPEYWDDFTELKKPEDENLAKKMSEAFSPLAQEFNSAVTNFNAEFQNAREISDVIPPRLTNFHLKEADFKDKNNNYLETNLIGHAIESKLSQSNDEILKDVEDRLPDYSRKDNSSEHAVESEQSKFRSTEFEKLNIHREDLGKEKHDSAKQFQADREERYSGLGSFESRQNVDESWKKRWYEAHPYLDSINEGLRLRASIRAHRIPSGNYSNESTHNVGEAGDIPTDRIITAEGPSSEKLDNSQEKNKGNSNPPSAKENNSCSSFSSDESSHSVTTGRSNRNVITVSSKNIPYSWRQMCRKQVSSTESEAKNFQLSQKTKESETSLNENVRASKECENLTEIIIGKDIKETYEPSKVCHFNADKTSEQPKMQEKSENESRKKKIVRDKASNNEEIQTARFYSEPEKVNESRENFYQQNIGPSDLENEGDKNSSNLKQAVDGENIMNLERKTAKENSVSSDVRQGGSVTRMYGPVKVEPGLNSACGDFAPATNIENYDHELSSQPSDGNSEEHEASIRQENFGRVAAEFLGEIVEIVAEEQEDIFKDSFEGLNFSSFSESDRSSDFSEAEEVSMSEALDKSSF